VTSASSTQATGSASASPASRRHGRTAAGLGAGVTAGLVWGLAFLLPVLLGGWNPVIVTVGRYLAYGLLSVLLFAVGGRPVRQLARRHWRLALAFAVAGNAGYYLLLVVGIRAAGAPLTDMVIGAIPVVVAVVGNWLSPSYPWRRLALPLILVTAGLAMVGALEIAGVHAYQPGSAAEKIAGLIAACGAVVLWTWYALANARFLAARRAVSPAHWATVVGVATGAVTLAALPSPRSPASSPPRRRSSRNRPADRGRGHLGRHCLLGGHLAVEPRLEPALPGPGRTAGQRRDHSGLRLRLRGQTALASRWTAHRAGPADHRRRPGCAAPAARSRCRLPDSPK
jgi:drug/metabolite transporter (DMT)-like permease